jgi:hypothetical protein
MIRWTPAPRDFVERILADQVARLSPVQLKQWQAIAVPLRSVPVASDPGQSVFVSAESHGRVVYFEDVEEGWNIAVLESNGTIADRGAEQDDLACVLSRLFQDGTTDSLPPNNSFERTHEG